MSSQPFNTGGCVRKISDMRNTLRSLEESLIKSRNLQAEQWLRYSIAKSKNRAMIDDLKKANKRNRNMLNLFRQSVTSARLGIGNVLPEPLNREVQRTWHKKYDALLSKNDELRKEAFAAKLSLEEKDREIDELRRNLTSFIDTLNERDLTIKQITSKYLRLKKQKEEEDALLMPCSSTPQNDKKTCKTRATRGNPLLDREIRSNNRLTFENTRLRALLREAKITSNNVTPSK